MRNWIWDLFTKVSSFSLNLSHKFVLINELFLQLIRLMGAWTTEDFVLVINTRECKSVRSLHPHRTPQSTSTANGPPNRSVFPGETSGVGVLLPAAHGRRQTSGVEERYTRRSGTTNTVYRTTDKRGLDRSVLRSRHQESTLVKTGDYTKPRHTCRFRVLFNSRTT